jgi:RNA polymerase sigma factor (sigma-70 family)
MTDRDQALQDYLANPTVATRNALIAHHHNLIHKLIRGPMRIPEHHHDDAFQEGVLGLCTAIDRFDPSLGKFSSYAALWIRSALKIWMERDIRHARCAPMKRFSRYREVESVKDSFQRVVRLSTSGEVRESGTEGAHVHLESTLMSSNPGPEERLESSDVNRLVGQMLRKASLDEREVAVIKENIFDDVSLHDLALRFGLTRQRMSQIKVRLLRRLGDTLEEGRC